MTNAVNVAKDQAYVVPFEQLRMTDVEIVGGKNASLGEMISQLAQAGVRVPTGFATTALAFRDFLHHSDLTERIAKRLETLDVDDVKALAEAGKEIRQWIVDAPLQPKLDAADRQDRTYRGLRLIIALEHLWQQQRSEHRRRGDGRARDG